MMRPMRTPEAMGWKPVCVPNRAQTTSSMAIGSRLSTLSADGEHAGEE